MPEIERPEWQNSAEAFWRKWALPQAAQAEGWQLAPAWSRSPLPRGCALAMARGGHWEVVAPPRPDTSRLCQEWEKRDFPGLESPGDQPPL